MGTGRQQADTGRRRLRGAEMRESIMGTAEAHLAEHGYMGVSLEEIAKEVGVTKPALYYHFPRGKEQLFVEVAHRAMRRTREGVERVMAAEKDGAGKLRAVALWLMGERERGQPMDELRDVAKFVGEGSQAGLAESFHGALYNPVHRTIAGAISTGEFRKADPDFLTWAFLGLVSGMMSAAGIPTEASAGSSSPGPPDLFHVPDGEPDGEQSEARGTAERTAERAVELFLNGALK